MSQPRKQPRYCLHKSSGQARMRINGRDVYLGPHDSPESHERYERLMREWHLWNGNIVAVWSKNSNGSEVVRILHDESSQDGGSRTNCADAPGAVAQIPLHAGWHWLTSFIWVVAVASQPA